METSIISWIYPRLRAHLSEPSAIPGLLSYLLIVECQAVIHERKWLGTTVTHFWRLTRLCRRPSAGSDGTSHLRVEVPARAKTRARISAAVKSISRNDDVRVRAFTSSAVKDVTQNRTVDSPRVRLIALEVFGVRELFHTVKHSCVGIMQTASSVDSNN